MVPTSLQTCVWLMLSHIAYTCAYECPKDTQHCVTSLTIDYAYTMYTATHGQIISRDRRLFYSQGNQTIPLPDTEPIISADGFSRTRKIIVANGTMPGPQIVMYEGQTITVMVHNELMNEEVTFHVHGVHQRHSPFMDGVPFVTQCPISHGQSFNYTFQPRYGGTSWYHSHVGNQRMNGLAGAFIVLRMDEGPNDVGHVLMITEWNHDYDLVPPNIPPPLLSHAVLVNGKGEYNNNEAPLHMLNAISGRSIRFRLIYVGTAFSFLFGIQDHRLCVFETDGFRVNETIVDRILIFSGERYDFTVDVGSAGQYDITADMYEPNVFRRIPKRGLALLNVTQDKLISANNITQGNLKVLNCPVLSYPQRPDVECIPLSNLKATDDALDPSELATHDVNNEPNTRKQTFFLNFSFRPNRQTFLSYSVNSVKFRYPTVSAISQPKEIVQCPENPHGHHCTHTLSLDKDAYITMVLLAMGNLTTGSHPIHVHGHTFDVMKMGFPTFHTNGSMIQNTDIVCEKGVRNEESYCSNASWRNRTWNDVIPGLNEGNHVRKDTVVVPLGGYTVIIFKASNPGIWLMHCHLQAHSLNGMALLLNESFEDFDKAHFYKVPQGFPVCRAYTPQTIGSDSALVKDVGKSFCYRFLMRACHDNIALNFTQLYDIEFKNAYFYQRKGTRSDAVV